MDAPTLSLSDETPEADRSCAGQESTTFAGPDGALHARVIAFSAFHRITASTSTGRFPSERRGRRISRIKATTTRDIAREIETMPKGRPRQRYPLAGVEGRSSWASSLKDIVKGGIKIGLRPAPDGHRTVMITGDNPLTAAAIAAESGVDDFLAQARPKPS